MEELPDWSGAKRVAIDIETCDPELKKLGPGVRRGGFIAGISFALEDGPAYYLPVRHEGGGNMVEEAVFAYLKEQIGNYSGTIVGANLSYDLDYLMEDGCDFSNVEWYRDVQIAEPLINELRHSYSLDNIAKYNNMPGKDEENLRFIAALYGYCPKGEMWRLPAKYGAKYAIRDVTLPLQLIRRQERKIEKQDLRKIYDLESRVLPILLKMRRRGVRIDMEKLAEIKEYCRQHVEDALKIVHELSGVELKADELDTGDKVAAPMEALGFTLPLTDGKKKTVDVVADGVVVGTEEIRTGRKPCTNKETLKALKHPCADALMDAKKYHKIIGTFVASIMRHQVNGRIHGTFKQLKGETDFGDSEKGAKFGRLSSVDPNMQQQPGRGKLGKMWRSIFLPEPGMKWACADFSSQEPRIAAHFAALTKCGGGKELAKRYNDNPRLDFHALMAALIGNPCTSDLGLECRDEDCGVCSGCGYDRKSAKAIFLGLAYGMGPAKLCDDLGLPTEWKKSDWGDKKKRRVAGPEGAKLFAQFDEMVPWVRQLTEKTRKRVGNYGFLVCLEGRRCRFPKKANGKGYDFLHKCLNRLIQGSAADQGKRAMVDLDAAGVYLQLAVHDEYDFSVTIDQEAVDAGKIMVDAAPLLVPVIVDVEVGPNWGDMKKVA